MQFVSLESNQNRRLDSFDYFLVIVLFVKLYVLNTWYSIRYRWKCITFCLTRFFVILVYRISYLYYYYAFSDEWKYVSWRLNISSNIKAFEAILQCGTKSTLRYVLLCLTCEWLYFFLLFLQLSSLNSTPNIFFC